MTEKIWQDEVLKKLDRIIGLLEQQANNQAVTTFTGHFKYAPFYPEPILPSRYQSPTDTGSAH